jgi:NAD(P)-dependent dehydrogenase (short-subunit alcohol dehydrogenase family)
MTTGTAATASARRLVGRVALVTGAAQGIGAATARRLSAEGAAVCVVDIDLQRGNAVVDELLESGQRAVFAACDVRREEEIAAAVATPHDRWGRLDILVNNAGVNAYFDAQHMTQDDWDTVFNIDVKASWLTVKHALTHLFESAKAAIVNVSSIHGRLTSAGMFPYAAAKSAVEGMTRSLALDYGPRGVRVNAVAPGWTRTALVDDWIGKQPDAEAAEAQIVQAHPLGRIATPEDIAAVVAFLASDDAAALTGTIVAADCGLGSRFAV